MTEKELVAKMLDMLIKSRKELANIDFGISKKSLPDLDKIIEHLNAPLMIMVMGEFSTGKSTFINAMVGEEVTAVNATPTTAVITRLCYGVKDKILVHFTDGTEKEYKKTEFKRLTSKTGKKNEDKTHESIEYVERQLPLDMLQYVTIIDSPGLNDINEKHSDTTKKFVNNADTVFWMFNALHAASKTEIEAMEALTPRLKPIAIINMMDEIDEEEDDPLEFLDNLRVQLKDKVQAVVGISAKYALEGKLEKNETKIGIGNLKELEQVVRELVLPNRDKFKLNTLMDELGEWINNIATDIQEAEKTNQKFQDIDYGKYLDIKTKLQKNNIVLVNIVEHISDYCIIECRRYNEQAMFLLGVLYEYGIYVNQDDSKAEQYQEAAAIKNHVLAQASLGCFFAIKNEFKKAEYWLNKAAVQNNKTALVTLASYKVIGKDFEKPCLQSDDDLKKAEPLLRKAANLGDDSAEYFLYILYKNGLGVEKDENRALKYLTQSVNHGNPDALNAFGELLVEDYKINYEPKELLKKAEAYFLNASEYGNSEALFNLGEIYREFEDKNLRYQKSFPFYKESALLGDDNAQYRLAEYYLNGLGVEEDLEQAFVWYQKSAEQENEKAQNMLGRCYEEGWGVEKDSIKAIEWFKKAAEQGNITGQINLGNSYYDGVLCEQDYKQAFIWYKKAAEQGNIEAQYYVASFYYNGWSVEKNDQQAFEWYKKAAEHSNIEAEEQGGGALVACIKAQGALAACYLRGVGTEKDSEQAFKWFSLTAEQGVAKDQHTLGMLYFNGTGTSKNEEKAFSWFKKAADQDNIKAQADVAYCYENGCGTEVDIDEALNWYKKAAEQGDDEAKNKIAVLEKKKQNAGVISNESYFEKCKREAEQGDANAQYELAVCYDFGNEVLQNDYQAFRWYEQAANKGNAQAQYALAKFYAQGRAVTQSTYTALIWYKKAAAQGYKKAELEINRLQKYKDEQQSNKKKDSVYTKDNSEAYFIKCKKAAEQGNANAQYDLALCYLAGSGTPRDEKEAFCWYQKAAEQGHVSAQFALEHCYKEGIGTIKDLTKAEYWYQKATKQENKKKKIIDITETNEPQSTSEIRQVNQTKHNKSSLNEDKQAYKNGKEIYYEKCKKDAEKGNMREQYELALCYEIGHGCIKNEIQAFYWYQKSAEQGYAQAQYALAGCYVNGIGVAPNKYQAIGWYRKAAAQGYQKAQLEIERLEAQNNSKKNGKVDLQNKTQNPLNTVDNYYEFYKRKAEAGDAKSQYLLAVCFANGTDTDKDMQKAIYWYKKSAEQGYVKAQSELAYCYHYGVGVAANKERAAYWYRKAIKQGDQASQERLGLLIGETRMENNQTFDKHVRQVKEWISKLFK